jgi:coiled-coil domain-containing protein 12
MSEGFVGRLEDEALKRKERLNALKRGEIVTLKKNTRNENTAASDKQIIQNEDEVDNLLKPIFRNYTPISDELKSDVLPKPALIEIETEIKAQLESAKPKPLIEKEIDLNNLVPQKIDWDLKRDLQKAIKLLEKKTQRAILELIRERLNKKDNLADLVNIGAGMVKSGSNNEHNQSDSSSSDEEFVENYLNNEDQPDLTNKAHNSDGHTMKTSIDDISDDEEF